MRAVHLRALVSLVAPLIFLTCSTLKVADQARDAGPEASTPNDEDAKGADAAEPIDGAPDATAPVDFACPNDAWSKTTKAKPECAARRVFGVDPSPALDPNGVAIARTPSGRVGIVYHAATSADSGEMVLVHFVPTTPSFGTPAIVKRADGFAMHWGFVAKIAATGPDTLHILSHDIEDISGSGDVNLYKLVDGTSPLTDPEVVLTAVERETRLGLAIDSSGKTYATVRVATGASTAKLSARRKAVGGLFEDLPDIATGLRPDAARDVGTASLLTDPGGQLHLLFYFKDDTFGSSPRYHTFSGMSWSYRKTLENPTAIDGISGFDPQLAVFGTRKLAVYYVRPGGQSVDPKVALHLATWVSSNDAPTIEILDQGIPAPNSPSPAFRVAMAVDKYGLVHVAAVRPQANNTAQLAYKRQTRTPSGDLKWLTDVVDPDVGAADSSPFVDMVVDDHARPHIAYRSGVDGLVRYATRFDR